ncbi:N-acetylmuraminidase, putative [Entamoeba nuttalli P19]|uniref:N-acetylmuraminidase, putative n=1 Tax=Entamoeba nuttalli (strain P19) TaxID=1076696 RepID=K2G867_ENTNP|nr:N-acetylmuraminidase, putative [Entamoeba nuttalli P19]EKE38611.1 N-acetylmuraminidase, putative [Entamoeba nuttalli P19]|eukprot:XP_008859053.1 N-acetylmuraminidase, putative [Entamoeba nuttalli P19]
MNCFIIALLCYIASAVRPIVNGPTSLNATKCLYEESYPKVAGFVGFNFTGRKNENAYKNNVNLITAGFMRENIFVVFRVCATCGTIQGQWNSFLRSTAHMQFEHIIFEVRKQYWYSSEIWNRMAFDQLMNVTADYPKSKYLLLNQEEWNSMFYLDYIVPYTNKFKLIYSVPSGSCSDKYDFIPFAGYNNYAYKYIEHLQTSCGTSYNILC